MNDKDRGELIKLVDSSGFIFQSKVAQILSKSLNGHPDIIDEQYWCLPALKKDGYADIVVVQEVLRFIIECKKSINDDWIFLSPKPVSNNNKNKFRWTHLSQNKDNYTYGWDEFYSLNIVMPESNQCILSKNKKESSLLESLGSTLLASVSAISNDEMKFVSKSGVNKVYIPVIVTNSKLHQFIYDFDLVDINTGKIKIFDNDPEIKEIPFVRYRKSMGVSYEYEIIVDSLIEMAKNNERTIFIVNSSSLSEFVKIINQQTLITYTENGWPWGSS